MVKRKTMGTVQDLRTAQKARLRSKPRIVGQEFLDLFILTKLKERFEREKERVEDGMKYVLRDIEEIAKDAELALAEDKAAIERLRITLAATGALEDQTQLKARARRPRRTARGAKRPQIIEY